MYISPPQKKSQGTLVSSRTGKGDTARLTRVGGSNQWTTLWLGLTTSTAARLPCTTSSIAFPPRLASVVAGISVLAEDFGAVVDRLPDPRPALPAGRGASGVAVAAHARAASPADEIRRRRDAARVVVVATLPTLAVRRQVPRRPSVPGVGFAEVVVAGC